MTPRPDGPANPDGAARVTQGTALRMDAERNRLRILASAQDLFSSRGLDVPLEDIAQHAGVGIATLYRRFPTRADLISATFERKIAEYTEAIDRALDHPDAWVGFSRLVYDLCELQASDAGLKELLTMRFPDSPVVEELTARAERNLAVLIDRAKAQGTLRAEFDPSDVLMLLLANAGIVTAAHADLPDGWRRFAAYMIDAFRATNTVGLPDPPPHGRLRRSRGNRSL